MKFKKSLIALMITVLIFASCLSLVASADIGLTIVGELLEEAVEYAFDSGDYGFLFNAYPSAIGQHFENLSDEDRQNIMSAYRDKMREADEYEPIDDESGWASDLKPIEFYLKMSAETWGAPSPTSGNYHYMIWAINNSGNYQINVRIIYDTAHYDDWDYFYNIHNEPCVERSDRANFSCVYCQIVDNTMFGGTTCRALNGTYYAQKNGCYTNQNMDNVYCYATDMGEVPLRFSSDFSAPSHKQYNITLTANKPVPDDLTAVFGVLYNDGTHVYDGTDCGYISADYIGSASLQGGNEWEWHFNQQEFSKWAYRKRIFDTDCFYAFVHVLDGNEIVYADSRKLNLSAPSDIFADTQELPDYSDYVNQPISLPNLLPTTFNYSPTTYQTVQNYNGTDFDFASFFGWYEDAFVTMANNMNAFFANAQAFMGAFADFSINGIVNAIGNLGSLIDDLNLNLTGNFNNFGDYISNLGKSIDFNNKLLVDNISNELQDSLGGLSGTLNNINFDISGYFGDLNSIISNNTESIIDNIQNAVDAQLVPDKIYVDWLVDNALPWYNQIRDALNSASYNNNNMELTINFGEVLGEHTMTYDDVETASQIRSVLEIILIASTVAGCARLGFQILGIDVSKAKGGE